MASYRKKRRKYLHENTIDDEKPYREDVWENIPISFTSSTLLLDQNTKERSCSQCNLNDINQENNNLMAPCHCRGRFRFIHRECLNQQRSASTEAFTRCSRCNFRYVLLPSIEPSASQLFPLFLALIVKIIAFILTFIGTVTGLALVLQFLYPVLDFGIDESFLDEEIDSLTTLEAFDNVETELNDGVLNKPELIPNDVSLGTAATVISANLGKQVSEAAEHVLSSTTQLAKLPVQSGDILELTNDSVLTPTPFIYYLIISCFIIFFFIGCWALATDQVKACNGIPNCGNSCNNCKTPNGDCGSLLAFIVIVVIVCIAIFGAFVGAGIGLKHISALSSHHMNVLNRRREALRYRVADLSVLKSQRALNSFVFDNSRSILIS